MSHVHIYRPGGHFIGQTRRYGHRQWTTVTGKCLTSKGAMAQAIRMMVEEDKRARVLFIDNSGYHEPHVCMEASR